MNSNTTTVTVLVATVGLAALIYPPAVLLPVGLAVATYCLYRLSPVKLAAADLGGLAVRPVALPCTLAYAGCEDGPADVEYGPALLTVVDEDAVDLGTEPVEVAHTTTVAQCDNGQETSQDAPESTRPVKTARRSVKPARTRQAKDKAASVVKSDPTAEARRMLAAGRSQKETVAATGLTAYAVRQLARADKGKPVANRAG